MNAPATAAATTVLQNSALQFQMVPVEAIKLSATPMQILRRSHFNQQSLAELTEDVKAHGVMQPVLLRTIIPSQGGVAYELVAGERRFMAAQAAGLTAIPAMSREITDNDMVEMQIAENLQRENLHPLEEAEGYQQLCKIHGCAARDLVPRVGKNEAHIYARLKLLKLCPQVKEEFYLGKLIPSIALEIARIPDEKMQRLAAKGCITGEDTGEFYRDGSGPLLFEDAREYIETEFMRRIEGNRAIAEARKAKLPAIDGDEAAKIWKAQSEPPAGHELLDGHYWINGERKAYCDVLPANAPGIVLIQSPFTGEAKRCLPRDAVIEIFKAKKKPLPNHMKQRELPINVPAKAPSSSSPSRGGPEVGMGKAHAAGGEIESAQARAAEFAAKKEKEREERETRKAQLAIDIQIAVFNAVRARYPRKVGKPELLNILTLVNQIDPPESGLFHPIDDLALSKMQERELIAYMLDYLYAHNVESAEYDNGALLAAAKRYGVNPAKIAKDMTAAFEAKERADGKPAAEPKPKTGATSKKPAAKKKASKK